jgi:hypothetical protein
MLPLLRMHPASPSQQAQHGTRIFALTAANWDSQDSQPSCKCRWDLQKVQGKHHSQPLYVY